MGCCESAPLPRMSHHLGSSHHPRELLASGNRGTPGRDGEGMNEMRTARLCCHTLGVGVKTQLYPAS